MYSTVSLAAYKRACADGTSAVRFPPPDEKSAYLLLGGDDSVSSYCCGGYNMQRGLPFPQDKCIRICFDADDSCQEYFIPVLGQAISSHCYHVVAAEGKHKGLVETCSTEEIMATTCFSFSKTVKDIHPRSLQPTNPYQRMQIISSKKYSFTSKCVAFNGFPANHLRTKDWDAEVNDMRGYPGRLAYVKGENTGLRAQLPSFDFSLLQRMSPIVIAGEWYCPFIFIKELGTELHDPKMQLMKCPFYKMVLQKFWEEIYSTQCISRKDVDVEKTLTVEEVLLFGEDVTEQIRDNDGSVLSKGLGRQSGQTTGVKLCCPIIAKMRADQDRYGLEQGGGDLRVKMSSKRSGNEGKFSCYVVVERYVLKRMDGSTVLTYAFRNSSQIREKWEM